MRILIADSQPRVQHALSVLLGAHSGWEVVGASGAAAGLRESLARLQPGVLLVDWHLAGLEGERRLAELRQLCPGLHLVVMSANPEDRRAAFAAGASEFICKVEPIQNLLDAVGRARPELAGGQVNPTIAVSGWHKSEVAG